MPAFNDATERPEVLAFLEASVAHPEDDTPLRILADWLDDHDDPRRAELLRLSLSLRATCCEPERHPERAAEHMRLVTLLNEGVRPCVPRRTLKLSKGESLSFAWIPPGTFLMGSPLNEPERGKDETQHRVTLTKGHWLGLAPVTQEQWQGIMGSNPSQFQDEKNLPVECVPWYDCQTFCQQLSQATGKRCRLPTEVEWEYACRAGTTTPYWWGDSSRAERMNYHARYPYGPRQEKGICRDKTTPVDSFTGNQWGLRDTHGNVREWCQDRYAAYPNGDSKDPQGGSNGAARVLRGGSWSQLPVFCRGC